MSRYFLTLILIFVISFPSRAQFRYSLNHTSDPYVPLSGSTSLNGSTIWDEDVLITTLPFIWKMDSSISIQHLHLVLTGPVLVPDTAAFTDLHGFSLGDVDIVDRGILTGTASLSPIRHQTIGTAPDRIFKLELFNAGFYEEYDTYRTMNDSFSMQVWLYETSNILEFRFGPSHVTHPGNYWGSILNGTGPLLGYFRNLDFYRFSSGTLYYLKGNSTAPGVDSFWLPAPPAANQLNSWPAAGTVYRFTPKQSASLTANAISGIAEVRIYPNPASLRITVEGLKTSGTVVVRSAIGMEPFHMEINASNHDIDITALPAGTYLLDITDKSETTNRFRFIKQ